MIEQFFHWQWRDAQTLWFILVPIVWWLVNRLLQQRTVNHYADNHLLPWVKVNNELVTKNHNFQLKSTQGGKPLGAFWSYLSAFMMRFIALLFKPAFMLAIAWACIIVALAGPRSSVPSPDEYTRAGVDILVALDLSLSMNAQDSKPNRYLFARSLIESLSNRLEPNDRLALLAYAAQPHLVSPLSFDRDLFQHYLGLLRLNMLPTQGSQIKPALLFGEQHLQQTAGNAKVLIVFTDGEPKNFVEQEEPLNFAELSQSTTKIILVGIGERTRVKIPDAAHRSGYLHHSGLLVTTRLEESFLQSLASELNGVYLKADRSQQFIHNLLKEVALDAEKRHFKSSHSIWQDHAMPFIWVAFFALLMAFYPIKWARKSATNLAPVLLLATWLHFLPVDALAQTKQAAEHEAFAAFNSQSYDLSQQLYGGIDGFQGWFGAGSAAYKAEDYESAVAYFREAALAGVTVQQRSNALFNLGNSYYRTNLLLQAVESYQQALKYLPDNEKTKHNLALAQQRRQVEEGQQQQDEEQGDGKGRGNQSRDDEGAFYGGQKPNNDVGEGVAGDSPEGEKQGKDFVLPQHRNDTDFSLQTGLNLQLTDNSIGNAIIARQRQVQRMEKFEQTMAGVQDKQTKLLIGIFEREEGFQATQEKPHQIPGVKPW